MSGRHASGPPPLEITRRDWKSPFAAVIAPALLYASLTIFLLIAAVGGPGEGTWIRMLQLATVLGRGVVDQLGWVFGVLVTIQLGCLIALLGGQIFAPDRKEEASLRSALSIFSFLPLVALSPAITVAAIAAFRVGELRGALFVIVPALLLTVSLSVFIGTLDVADELTKQEFARDDEARAQNHIIALMGLPDASVWRTSVVRSAVLVMLWAATSVLLILISGVPIWPAWVYATSFAFIAFITPATICAVIAVSASIKPKLSADAIATTGLLLPAMLMMHIVAIVTLFALAWQLGIGALIAFSLLVVDTVRVFLEAQRIRAGRRPAGFWRSGGRLANAGTSIARRAAVKERDSAQRRVADLDREIERRAGKAPVALGRRRMDASGH